jgi:hypothetical protein
MIAHRCTARIALGLVTGVLVIAPAAAQPTMSSEARAVACGPRASYEPPATGISVGGSLTEAKGVYAPWHRLVVNGGSEDGLKAGQEYFVRRVVRPREPLKRGEKELHAITTAGWIRIDETQARRSIASVVHECDGISPGDYLEPFSVPSVPTPLPEGKADFAEPGHVLFGAERQTIGGSGSMVLIDQGSKHGIQPGQRFTIYRPSSAGPNVIVARAIAMDVQPEITLVKIQDMRDAVSSGDLVAPHR